MSLEVLVLDCDMTPIFKILKHEYHELHNKPCGLGVPEALAVSVIVSMILIVAEINS
jgi:hypothetical protein